jgi:tRNA pseudouridine65 synthase
MLEILFENETLIAINKPHGLLVHKTSIAADVKTFAVQQLRDQIGQRVYPAHRLDRKTAGVLLFAKNKSEDYKLQKLFRERKVEKNYKAIVRGYTDAEGLIDYALKEKEGDRLKEAVTAYTLIKRFEIDIPSAGFPSSRYSLVDLKPRTGRYHQLRKHMAHIFHPIIGDRPHGCNKQNKLWKENFNMMTMLLHASHLVFDHPDYGTINIEAGFNLEFCNAIAILKERKI